jgi:transcriptional regulator with XRE-family HTH domain
MASGSDTLAAIMGDRFRRARRAARLLQREAAARAGVSPTMLCRMELGRGGSVPLDAWVAVAAVLGLDLVPEVQEPDGSARGQLLLRCHALVTEVAREGGWQATTEIMRPNRGRAPEEVETVLVRPLRKEVAVVHAWHPVPNVGPALDALEARCAQIQRRHGADWQASALVVCPSTTAGRRRVTELAPRIAAALPADASEWIVALRHVRSPMPPAGLLWTDRWAVRFRPAARRPGWQRQG